MAPDRCAVGGCAHLERKIDKIEKTRGRKEGNEKKNKEKRPMSRRVVIGLIEAGQPQGFKLRGSTK